MKACTSINVFFDSEFQASVQEQMRRTADGGFRHVDMNFWDWSHSEKSPFKQPDWRRWVEGIGAAARRMGLAFTQAHAHVYNFYAFEPENPHEEQIRRSIEGAGMLGIPWVVLHPSQRPDWEDADSLDRMIAENAVYFRGLAMYAQQFGVGLALENMSAAKHGLTTAGQLCRLIEAVGMPNVGACWDTGHAHLSGQDQPASLRELGERLHALHIADNHGATDEHMPPFFGSIDWPPILAALREIGYDGDFTFEAHNLVRRVPAACQAEAIRLLYQIGAHMVEEAGEW